MTAPTSSSGVTSPPPRPRALLLLAAAVAGAILIGYAIANPPPITAAYLDFDAFYWARRFLSAGGDPYRYEPLHACEARLCGPPTANAVGPGRCRPMPSLRSLPLGRLSYERAQFLWWLLLLAGGMLIVWALVELTALPLLLVGSCVLVGVLLPSLMVGSLALLPIALLCLSAVAVARERWAGAALLQGAACVEPHLALPVLLATFVFVPRARLALATVVGVLFVTSAVAGRAALNLEYVLRVLPAHSTSEIGNAEQYSLSALLHAAGLGDGAASAIASAQYLLFIAAALWIAGRLRSTMPEGVVLVPMALAVTGGPFVHVTQIGAAIPLAMLVAARTRSAAAWGGLACLAVAIPWQASIGYGGVLAAFVLLAILAYNRVAWIVALPVTIALAAALQLLQAPSSPAARSSRFHCRRRPCWPRSPGASSPSSFRRRPSRGTAIC